jgi:DNA-binding IclR family transcriptional regulator
MRGAILLRKALNLGLRNLQRLKSVQTLAVKRRQVTKSIKKDKLSAIEKTLEILITFTHTHFELSTGEISKLTGFHKATTSRILSTLVDYGLLAHNDERKKYSLGPLTYRLGLSRGNQSIQGFVALSSPLIDRLRDSVNESISLEVWSGRGTIACYFAESRDPLRVSMVEAEVLPLHAPAGAKAILSYMHKEQVSKLLEYEFDALTENTLTSKSELLARLGQFHQQGYATDNQELHLGIYAIGVPVFDYVGKPKAAVCMVMPAARITPEKEAEAVMCLKRTATDISNELKKLPSSYFSVWPHT